MTTFELLCRAAAGAKYDKKPERTWFFRQQYIDMEWQTKKPEVQAVLDELMVSRDAENVFDAEFIQIIKAIKEGK